MTAEALIATLETRGVRLAVHGDRLSLDAPKGVLTPDIVAELRERKPEVLDLLTRPNLIDSSTVLRNERKALTLPPGVSDNVIYLPELPATGLTGDVRRKAYSDWWEAIKRQRRAGVVGRARSPRTTDPK